MLPKFVVLLMFAEELFSQLVGNPWVGRGGYTLSDGRSENGIKAMVEVDTTSTEGVYSVGVSLMTTFYDPEGRETTAYHAFLKPIGNDVFESCIDESDNSIKLVKVGSVLSSTLTIESLLGSNCSIKLNRQLVLAVKEKEKHFLVKNAFPFLEEGATASGVVER